MTIKLYPSFAVHPGAWLRAGLVEPYGLSVTDAAAKPRVTRQAMSTLLDGRAGLWAKVAIRFEKAFGISAGTLMRMQAAYDLAQFSRAGEDDRGGAGRGLIGLSCSMTAKWLSHDKRAASSLNYADS